MTRVIDRWVLNRPCGLGPGSWSGLPGSAPQNSRLQSHCAQVRAVRPAGVGPTDTVAYVHSCDVGTTTTAQQGSAGADAQVGGMKEMSVQVHGRTVPLCKPQKEGKE